MRMHVLAGALSLTLLFGWIESFSQCKELRWPADAALKAKAEESKTLYENLNKAGKAKQAEVPLNWLLANVPQLHSSLYINGADIFDKLASEEKHAARRKVYVDSLLIVYDLRIKTCGEEATVTNRKALSFVKYNIKEKPAEALELLEKSLSMNGNNVLDATLVPYFQTIRLNVSKFKNITEDQILEKYDKVMNIIDAKIKAAQSKGQPVDKYKKMKDDVDAILISMVKIDCAFVKKNLGPKFKQNPNDVVLARKIFGFMLQFNCTDDPLWLQAGESVNRNSQEKDFGLIKNLGVKYYSLDNMSKAEDMFKQALPVAKTGKEKAEILIYLGQLKSASDKAAARALFRQALEADPENKLAYEKIGDLYYDSYDACAKKGNVVDDRLVYLVAADYYQRAGDAKKIAEAKASFPSKEELSVIDYKQGDTKNVGCWIEESTTIRTRD